MNLLLTPDECRVLGSLIEKEITTPEYYPLSLNALLNACNQKSNRDPVTNLDEPAVRQALHSLSAQSLVRSSASDSRVSKYEHRLQEAFNFYRHEIAILCVLLLRGPQTPGELRTRSDRMHHFDDLSAVHSSLNHLMQRDPPLVKVLPRQPGTKEARYAHLLSGHPEVAGQAAHIEGRERAGRVEDREHTCGVESLQVSSSETQQGIGGANSGHQNAAPHAAPSNSVDSARLARLEAEVASLRNDIVATRNDIAALHQQFAAFRKQFD